MYEVWITSRYTSKIKPRLLVTHYLRNDATRARDRLNRERSINDLRQYEVRNTYPDGEFGWIR